MSSFLAQTRARVPRLADAVAQQRTRLSVVSGSSRTSPRVPFAALVLGFLGVGLVGLLLLNTSLQQGAVQATQLQARMTGLELERQALELRVDALRDPQRVATAARDLGMVPNVNPAFLRLSDGRVLGDPAPAQRGSDLRLQPQPPRPQPVVEPVGEPARIRDRASDGARGSGRQPGNGQHRGEGR